MGDGAFEVQSWVVKHHLLVKMHSACLCSRMATVSGLSYVLTSFVSNHKKNSSFLAGVDSLQSFSLVTCRLLLHWRGQALGALPFELTVDLLPGHPILQLVLDRSNLHDLKLVFEKGEGRSVDPRWGSIVDIGSRVTYCVEVYDLRVCEQNRRNVTCSSLYHERLENTGFFEGQNLLG